MNILEYIRNKTGQPGIQKKKGVWFCAPYRDDDHPSLEVSEYLGKWHDWGSGEYGDIYNLVQKCENCDFKTAKSIVGEQTKVVPYEKKIVVNEWNTNKIFYHTQLIDYARCRCVDFDVLKKYAFELIDHNYYYIAICNESGGYAVRNEFFKGNKGANDITIFSDNKNNSAIVFEGMFDFLSYASKCFKNVTFNYDCIVLNTTSNINKIPFEKYQNISLCLDNDTSGKRAAHEILSHHSNCKDFSFKYVGYDDVNDFICNKFKIK